MLTLSVRAHLGWGRTGRYKNAAKQETTLSLSIKVQIGKYQALRKVIEIYPCDVKVFVYKTQGIIKVHMVTNYIYTVKY